MYCEALTGLMGTPGPRAVIFLEGIYLPATGSAAQRGDVPGSGERPGRDSAGGCAVWGSRFAWRLRRNGRNALDLPTG